jgi:hypothetical protein
VGDEFREELHAFGFSRLALGKNPQRAMQTHRRAWHPGEQWVGVPDETGERRDAEALPNRHDLRLVGGDRKGDRGRGNFPAMRPVWHAMLLQDDPAERRGFPQQVTRHVDGAMELRPFPAVQVLRQSVAVIDHADCDIRLAVGQIGQFVTVTTD